MELHDRVDNLQQTKTHQLHFACPSRMQLATGQTQTLNFCQSIFVEMSRVFGELPTRLTGSLSSVPEFSEYLFIYRIITSVYQTVQREYLLFLSANVFSTENRKRNIPNTTKTSYEFELTGG